MIFHLSTFTPESLVASSLLPSANVYLPIIVLFKIKLAKIAIQKDENSIRNSKARNNRTHRNFVKAWYRSEINWSGFRNNKCQSFCDHHHRNVAINGESSTAIAAPEIKPTTAPIKIPPSTATQTGKPKLTANTPVITEDKVSTVPQDKSIPLVTIIIVAPKARMPVTAVDKRFL